MPEALSTFIYNLSSQEDNVNTYQMPEGVEHSLLSRKHAIPDRVTTYQMPEGVEHDEAMWFLPLENL